VRIVASTQTSSDRERDGPQQRPVPDSQEIAMTAATHDRPGPGDHDAPDLLTLPLGDGDIVFGASYSAHAYEALRCAATIAWARNRRLRVVRVLREVEWLTSERPAELLDAERQRALLLVDDLVQLARRIAPLPAVEFRVLTGSLLDALVDDSGAAGLLVLGLPVAAGRPDGSGTITWFLQNAACPVLAVDAAGHRVHGTGASF
jgi:nucleotide-binding universal stress UspA family protein